MKRRPVLIASAMTAGVVLLGGCGVGQRSQTYEYKASADSTSANADLLMALRGVYIPAPGQGDAYAEGEDAPVEMVLVNSSTTDDTLVSASSSAAESVVLKGADDEDFVLPGGQLVEDYSLMLTGLKQELAPAAFVDITVVFQNAGSVTLSIPVRTSDEEAEHGPYEVGEVGSNFEPLGDATGESLDDDETESAAE